MNGMPASEARPVLHDYFRSSAAYRVRIALALKGIAYDSVSIDLRTGAQGEAAYRGLNRQGLVPMLAIDGHRLTQSLAIIDYLDRTRPEPALLPVDPAGRARVQAMALLIASDIHPIDNLRVLAYLRDRMGQDQAARDAWYAHWIVEGLTALETMAGDTPYLSGDRPGLADLCLVPQLYNARRFAVPLDACPRLVAIDARLAVLPAWVAAHPDRAAPAS